MKKLLFIYYMFPPLVGGWRAIGSMTRYLPELGWQATVISAAENVRYPKDYSSLRSVPDHVQVRRVGHREWSPQVLAALNRLRINVVFPDSFKSWYAPALQEGRRILSREKFDLIFSYGPPYTCHFVAQQLKREVGIPWVAGLADLWSDNSLLTNALIQPLRLLQTRRIEREEQKLLREADQIIVRCRTQRQQLCETRSVKEDKVVIIGHGYDESDHADLKPYVLYPDKLTVTHLGSFYSLYREPFLKFLGAVGEVAEDNEVILIGQGTALDEASNERLTRISYLPQRKALALSLGSDLLIAITHPSVKWTMMKLYDYLRLGRPILALVPEDGDTARIVREARAGFVLSYDPETMKQQLQSIIERWRKGEFQDFQPDQEYVAQLERKNLTRQMLQIFDEVSSSG